MVLVSQSAATIVPADFRDTTECEFLVIQCLAQHLLTDLRVMAAATFDKGSVGSERGYIEMHRRTPVYVYIYVYVCMRMHLGSSTRRELLAILCLICTLWC